MASRSRSTKLDLVREVEEEAKVAVVDTEEVDMEEGVMEVTVEVVDRTEVCDLKSLIKFMIIFVLGGGGGYGGGRDGGGGYGGGRGGYGGGGGGYGGGGY